MRAWLASALCCVSACGPHSSEHSPSARPLPARFHYDVHVDAKLSRVDATVCFDGASPDELRPGRDEAASSLLSARALSPGPVRRLPSVGGRIRVDGVARDACIAYSVRLDAATTINSATGRVGRDVLASPNVWLWRPERRAANAEARLVLHLPDGIRASLPWRRLDEGSYVLDADAFRFDSYGAFGRFEPVTFERDGLEVELTVLDGKLNVDSAALQRWLALGVRTARMVGDGPFPAARVQAIVVPTASSGQPVSFGTVARGGAASVLLFVAGDASEPELERDWVLPHELSHLWLPFVPRADAWLSEGLATYFEEVLRARAGILSEHEAVEKLAEGMRSAAREGTGRAMLEESRDMMRTYAFRPVYWGGAAFFLVADVELRRRSGGKRSLDDVLLALRRESPRTRWTAATLLARMDELAGEAVFVPLAREVATRSFPAFEPTLAALGVETHDGELKLSDSAELSAVRKALFRAPNAAR